MSFRTTDSAGTYKRYASEYVQSVITVEKTVMYDAHIKDRAIILFLVSQNHMLCVYVFRLLV